MRHHHIVGAIQRVAQLNVKPVYEAREAQALDKNEPLRIAGPLVHTVHGNGVGAGPSVCLGEVHLKARTRDLVTGVTSLVHNDLERPPPGLGDIIRSNTAIDNQHCLVLQRTFGEHDGVVVDQHGHAGVRGCGTGQASSTRSGELNHVLAAHRIERHQIVGARDQWRACAAQRDGKTTGATHLLQARIDLVVDHVAVRRLHRHVCGRTPAHDIAQRNRVLIGHTQPDAHALVLRVDVHGGQPRVARVGVGERQRNHKRRSSDEAARGHGFLHVVEARPGKLQRRVARTIGAIARLGQRPGVGDTLCSLGRRKRTGCTLTRVRREVDPRNSGR